jgi:signal transduction histidine kinase
MMTVLEKSPHILLVDDSPTNLKVLAEAIQGQGWKTLMATDGESAIEQAEYVFPDLILLDVMMPGIDGFETCRRLKADTKTQDIPVIFMTALSESSHKVQGLELGAVDYITKPFQQDEVIARVKLHLQLSFLRRTLEQQVEARTSELTQSVQRLQQAQLQLVQSEKMSTLGQLVAGIGHEINNPINFINGNLTHVERYAQDLFELIDLYQETLPEPGEKISELIEDLDLEYMRDDLPKLMSSMQEGMSRLRDISYSLRTFARADIASKVEFQIHEGFESTIMLLKHRLKPDEHHPEIQIVKQYGQIPPISCYPGPLNQVFMNLIANALDAFEEMNEGQSYAAIAENPNTIAITTSMTSDDIVVIRLQDNGPGIAAELQSQIFEENFTTKPVGKGTGLGLAISKQIIEEKHCGTLECHSTVGQGTEFVITLPV